MIKMSWITWKKQINKYKDLFLSILILTKFTYMKHENNTNNTQLPGTYIFMAYLPVIVIKEVNIENNENINRYKSE